MLPRFLVLGFVISLISLSIYLIYQDFPEKYKIQLGANNKVLGLTLKAPQKLVKTSAFPTPTPQGSPGITEIKHQIKGKLSSTTQPKKITSVIKTASANNQGAYNSLSVLQALNDYRSKKGIPALSLDQKLTDFAQTRVLYFSSIGKIDNHAGFRDLLNNDGFNKMGFWMLAENSSTGYRGDAVGLIESFYGKSAGHDANQLNPSYTHIGIGVSGLYTNLVFGGRKK